MTSRVNIKILIVGDGPDKDFLQETADDLGLGDSLIMVGTCRDSIFIFS